MNEIKENVTYWLPDQRAFLDFVCLAEEKELRWHTGQRAILFPKDFSEVYGNKLCVLLYGNALWCEDVDEMEKQGFEITKWVPTLTLDQLMLLSSMMILRGVLKELADQ